MYKILIFQIIIQNCQINHSKICKGLFRKDFLFKMIFSLSAQGPMTEKPQEIVCHCSFLNIVSMKKAVDSMEERKSLFQKGVESAADFIRG